jgi:hypothetical protein
MIKFLRIPDFAKAGLNSDLMPWDLPGSFLTDIKNVRISRNKLSPFGGFSKWTDLPVDFDPGYLMHVGSVSGEYWLIAGQDKVLSWDAATISDVSNPLGYPGSLNQDDWSGCMLSNIPILNNPGWYPEFWSPPNPGSTMTLLPWDSGNTWQDVGESCKIMRSHKQFLFAMDLLTGGQEITDGVRWSAPADVNGVPPTWDPLDTTNFAGFVTLGGAGGKIIDGYSLRDAFCIYREGGISIFDYVGGQFVWQIRHLSDTVGLVSKDALVEIKGSHFLIGDGDVLVNDGNSIRSLMHNRIRQRFVSDYDADNFANSYAVRNNAASEVWFCVPESGEVYPTLAYIYNWKDDTWSIRDLPRTPHANYGSQSSPPITWDNIGGTWDTVPGPWDARQLTPFDDTIVGITKPEEAGESGSLVLLDKGATGIDTPFNTSIERVGFALEGLNEVTTITRIYPHMAGPSPVNIRIGSQEHPGAPVRWKAPIAFNPETDRKIDIRTTGELHCFRISANNVTSTWDISGMDIEYVESGKR